MLAINTNLDNRLNASSFVAGFSIISPSIASTVSAPITKSTSRWKKCNSLCYFANRHSFLSCDLNIDFIVKSYHQANIYFGGCLNINMSSIEIPMLKIRRSRDRLIFNMRILIHVKDGLYNETGPWTPFSRMKLGVFQLYGRTDPWTDELRAIPVGSDGGHGRG